MFNESTMGGEATATGGSANRGWRSGVLRAMALTVAGTLAVLLPVTAASADETGSTPSEDFEVVDFNLPGFDFVDDIAEPKKAAISGDNLPEAEFAHLLYGDISSFEINFPKTGLSGLLSLDHVEQMPLLNGTPQTSGLVGDAKLNWRLSESLLLSTSVGRRLAETDTLGIAGLFEETVGGGFTYYISPRLQMSAEGLLATQDFSQQSLVSSPSEAEASFIATYQFLPFFSGRVNYTYELQNPLQVENLQTGAESKVSFTLIGKF